MTLEWRTHDAFGYTVHAASTPFHGILGGSEISPSEKHGGYNIHGLRKSYGTGWAETLDEAKAIAADDLQRRERLKAWQEYMETNDPPNFVQFDTDPPTPMFVESKLRFNGIVNRDGQYYYQFQSVDE